MYLPGGSKREEQSWTVLALSSCLNQSIWDSTMSRYDWDKLIKMDIAISPAYQLA